MSILLPRLGVKRLLCDCLSVDCEAESRVRGRERTSREILSRDTLTASVPGDRAGTLQGMTAPASRIAALAIMVLWIGCAHGPRHPETGTLTGTVVDTRGSAIAGARVYLVGPPRDGYDANGLAEKMVTRTDGTFQFRKLFPGIYTVDVSTESFGTRFKKDVQIDPGRVTEVELVAPAPPAPAPPIPDETRMGTIQGKVVSEDGREHSRGGAVFALGTQRGAIINSTGRFTFRLPSGVYTLRARCPGYKQVDQDSIHVSENDTTTVDFKFREQLLRIMH
jgi:hypothetical protein